MQMTQLLLMSLQQQSELGVEWPTLLCFQVAENWCCDQSYPCFHRGRWTCRVLKDSAKSLAVPSGFAAPPLQGYTGPYQTRGTPQNEVFWQHASHCSDWMSIPITYPETGQLHPTATYTSSPLACCLWYPCQWHASRTPHCKGCCDQSWAPCEHSPPILLPASAVIRWGHSMTL